MDSDANHTVRDILLTGVSEVRHVVVQTKPVSFAPGVVVGAHVEYWVYKYMGGLPSREDWRDGLLPLLIANKFRASSQWMGGLVLHQN